VLASNPYPSDLHLVSGYNYRHASPAQKDIMILILYNNRVSKYMKKILLELPVEVDESIIKVENQLK
jgi:hypothetical protein